MSVNKLANLKVVTLNIWGIRYISKDVSIRINALIEALNGPQSDYDAIALQEVWSKQDFLNIKKNIENSYPYSHYFESGLVGSGCCVFSKHFIEDVFYHKFCLNGYPHKLNHGDWFAGKLVGLVRIKYNDLSINVYTTHLHANYSENFTGNKFNDEYLGHRMTQLFELAQFIQKTSHMADATLLMGDLNTEEFEDGFKMLLNHSELSDAFKETTNKKDDFGITCHHKKNYYQANEKIRKLFPEGIRIDFILFKSQNKLSMKCINCETCLGKIPNFNEIKGLNYSDHEGVHAEFELEILDNKPVEKPEKIVAIEYYENIKSIINRSHDYIFQYQLAFLALALALLSVLFNFNDFHTYFVFAKNLTLSIVASYLIAYCMLLKNVERTHLKYTMNAIDVTIDSIKRNYRAN